MAQLLELVPQDVILTGLGLLCLDTQSLPDFGGQLQHEVLRLDVPSDSDPEQASFLGLLVEAQHHFLGVGGNHEHEVANDPIEGTRGLHDSLPIAAFDAKMVFCIICLLVDIDRHCAQVLANVLAGQPHHGFADVDR